MVDYIFCRTFLACFLSVRPELKEILSGLSSEDKSEVTSFMGSVNAKARDTLQVHFAKEGGGHEREQ